MSSFLHETDVDECTTGEANCHVNALCSNTVGLYVCRCIRGYEGDGKTCTGWFKLHEFTSHVIQWIKCSMMQNTQCSLGNLYTFQFACFLKTNQSLQNFNSIYPPTINMCYSRSQYFVFHLLDRNECEDGSASCPANSDCFNTDGSYSCRCTEGYQLNEAGNCIGLYPSHLQVISRLSLIRWWLRRILTNCSVESRGCSCLCSQSAACHENQNEWRKGALRSQVYSRG